MFIIFLDMDGVLNCSSFVKKWKEEHGSNSVNEFRKKYCIQNMYFIVPELMERFHNLFEQINKIEECKIVWSSSWRHTAGRNSKPFIEALFYNVGLPKESFLGYTPTLSNGLRYNEILNWLDDHNNLYSISKAIIIDDDKDADPMMKEYLDIKLKFFKTSMEFGLTEKISNNILKFLRKN